ncbi:CgeB family protein, partial [Nesterenkonia suensis]
MTSAHHRGLEPRQTELDRARARVAELLDSPDPLAALRSWEDLSALGVPAASPFWGGRAGGEALIEELLPALMSLPRLEHGASRPALPCTVALLDDPWLTAPLQGAADLRPIAADDEEAGVAVAEADAVLLTPRAVRTPMVRGRAVRAAREASVPLIYVDLTRLRPDPHEIRVASRCDVVLAVSETGAEEYRRSMPASTHVATVTHPISPVGRSPLGSRHLPLQLVAHLEGRGQETLDGEARRSLEWILDGVIASGSQLLVGRQERHAGINQHITPWRHRPYLAPSALPHAAAVDRLAPVGVVAQEVGDSQSLFAPRTLDLLASGTLVLSTYNQGLNSHFPEVRIANSVEDVAGGLTALSLEELRQAQSDGVRHAFSRHHAVDVLHQALTAAGLSLPPLRDRVLAVSDTADCDDRLLMEDLQVQTVGPVELADWSTLPDRHGSFDVLVPVSAARRYSPTYVADHLAALSYQSAPVTAKVDAGRAEDADSHAQRHHPGSVLRPVPSATKPVDVSGGHLSDISLSAWLRPAAEALASAEALCADTAQVHLQDHLGHVPRRRPRVEVLTEDDEPEAIRREVAQVASREGLTLSVIVPVYNNGDHLRHKAFASLRRSSIFSQMHILLIDDGSTDP